MAKCDVCDKEYDKLIDDEFWDQRVCEKHESDGTPRCYTCFKFLKETKYLDLTDGRKLCSDCSSIAIIDPKECKPLIQYVHEFYRSLNLKTDEDIRVLLLDKNAMLKFKSPVDNMRGTVWYSFGGLRALVRIKKCSKIEGSIEVERKLEMLRRPHKLTARRRSSGNIEALIVLFGMANVDMGATVAHEMMHAWLYTAGVTGLEERVEEGFCELMSYMWMEWFCSSRVDSLYKTNEQVQYSRKLKDLLSSSMEYSEDEIYGQGFRDARTAVSKFGLRTVLDHIVKKRCLPYEG
ncbi:protein DA1-like [Rosa rugosa]|uniref:protein DA1-like n=1 Tax=Rosa rugosa TaxID=74645 RepID=UPI002B4083D8|nr:protein DA1-like [Rosa rugosa]